jgi:uncharacterized protein
MNKSHSWLSPKLEVRQIQNFGKGVFAKNNVNKNELLAIFGGYIMTLDEEQQLPVGMRDYAHQIAPNFVIGINKQEDIQSVDFFNHSCDPNAGFQGQIFLVAMRNIQIGEQITFDYAIVLSVESYDIKCLCGSKNCRKHITGNDWKISSLQKKYRGYFQPYLEDKIEKLKK